jgi:NAD(P) transhydrogenase subunit alpha
MYARNVFNFVELLVKDDALTPDFDDDLIAKSCVTHAGEKRFLA